MKPDKQAKTGFDPQWFLPRIHDFNRASTLNATTRRNDRHSRARKSHKLLELSDYVPTTHHDTYPYITPTSTELSGKSVLVTGASRGLRRVIAIRSAKAGCARIALLARSSLDSLINEIETQARKACTPPPQLLALQVDITSDAAVQAAAKEVDDAFEGQLDILVNNADYLPEFKLIHESDPIEWWKAWEINVKGTFLSCHYLIPLLSQSDTRIVINMSSIGGNCLTYGGPRTRRRDLRIADSRSS